MQEAANSSALVPLLLEQIFKRLSGTTDEKDKEYLLLDLHKLFGGRLVAAALNILDNQSILIYNNSTKTQQIAEICDNTNSIHFVRFFPHINYCICEYFQVGVLTKESYFPAPYTCQHLLAVRLAIALQHRCLSFKEVPTNDFDLLLASIVPSILQEE